MRRREVLGMTSGAGLAFLGEVLRRRAVHASDSATGSASTTTALPGFGRAKSVLVVIASGGQSQLETWDPRPDALIEV